MVLTVHRWFANKSCPGSWMYARMSDLAEKVTVQLGGNYRGHTVIHGDTLWAIAQKYLGKGNRYKGEDGQYALISCGKKLPYYPVSLEGAERQSQNFGMLVIAWWNDTGLITQCFYEFSDAY